MIEPSLSHDEPLRLAALRKTGLLDTPLEERFERITRLAQRLLNMPTAALSLVDANRQWFKSGQGMNAHQSRRTVSFCGHTVLQSTPFVVNDARIDPRFSDNPLVVGEEKVVFYAGCPVRSEEGHNLASLCVIDHKPRELSADDLQVLQDLAALAESEFASAMQNDIHEKLSCEVDAMERHKQVDTLTRVWSHDAIAEVANEEFDRARTTHRHVGAMVISIDNLRELSKTNGQDVGDDVLREVAKRTLTAIRQIDAVGRFGGEEFLVVLSNCEGAEDARHVAHSVHRRICETPIETRAGQFQVSVSIGLASGKMGMLPLDKTFVDLAEGALQTAQGNGGNCVATALMNVQRECRAVVAAI